jgi:hypothetical protein
VARTAARQTQRLTLTLMLTRTSPRANLTGGATRRDAHRISTHEEPTDMAESVGGAREADAPISDQQLRSRGEWSFADDHQRRRCARDSRYGRGRADPR